jgi:hypothetical protein
MSRGSSSPPGTLETAQLVESAIRATRDLAVHMHRVAGELSDRPSGSRLCDEHEAVLADVSARLSSLATATGCRLEALAAGYSTDPVQGRRPLAEGLARLNGDAMSTLATCTELLLPMREHRSVDARCAKAFAAVVESSVELTHSLGLAREAAMTLLATSRH